MIRIQDLLNVVNLYYPPNIDLEDMELLTENNVFKRLMIKCEEANQKNEKWTDLLHYLRSELNVEILDYTLLFQFNPSFIAAMVADEDEQCNLILKISVIAPVYSIYFDNCTQNFNQRFIRTNALTELEEKALLKLRNSLSFYYEDYSPFNFSLSHNIINSVGNIKINGRKPYLDELIFGRNLNCHPS